MTTFPITLPEPSVAPLDHGAGLRWGILAPGEIAGDFAHALHTHTQQRIHAVGSRSLERALAFAAAHQISRSYGSYEELVADDEIDIVYISAPNSEHAGLARLAIAHGKHVLIEKPMAANAKDAQDVFDAAQAAGVFAMEAMWSAFLPQTSMIKTLLNDGVFGDISVVTADFGADFSDEPEAIVFQPELAGGVLRDIGIYPLWFSYFVLGQPSHVLATGSAIGEVVDSQAAMILNFDDGAQSVLYTTMSAPTPTTATISGTEGQLEVHAPFLMPSGFSLRKPGSDQVLTWHDETGLREREGLAWQAAAVARHIADGLLESPVHSRRDTLSILTVLDEARRQVLATAALDDASQS